MSVFSNTSGGGVDSSKVKILLENELSEMCYDDSAITVQSSDDVFVAANSLKLPATKTPRSNLYPSPLSPALCMPRKFIENQATYILPEPWFQECFQRTRSEASTLQTSSEDGIDIKSGTLLLLGQMGSEEYSSRVFVKVFGNKYEQHAQFYTDADYSEPLGYISLRNCRVSLDQKNIITICIMINRTAMTRQVVKLVAASGQEAIEWARAFIPKHELSMNSEFSPKGSPCLPRSTRSSPLASESLDA